MEYSSDTGRQEGPARRAGRPWSGTRHVALLFIALAILLLAAPVSAVPAANGSAPQIVTISSYVVDFNRVDVGAGTVGIDFYLDLKSDTPVSINDIELMNGMITSTTVVKDTPLEKEYRVIAVLTSEPDLSRYPFDRHTLKMELEPRQKNEQEMILVIDPVTSALYHEADLPGWSFSGTRYIVTNESYGMGEVPYSRAVFSYSIERDSTSTILKFFLPIVLIVIVSLSSLMMKTTSRLGLNASMFLAAVLIHWRIADAIPLVGYATFLDIFMIITYSTLVLVLLSGLICMKFSEEKNTVRIEQVNRWSIPIIPALCITLYLILFLTLVR